MLTSPDSHGLIKKGNAEKAEQIWKANATHLHVNTILQFNSNATAAAFTERKSLGGRVWTTAKMESPDKEKAMCVWLNSTLGMISYWLESNRNQDGRGGISVTSIPDLRVLDVTQLDTTQLDATMKIFNDLKEQTLKPANEAWNDPVRQELDQRLFTEVLNLDADAVTQLDILRRQWCKEPTVTAAKPTGPPD